MLVNSNPTKEFLLERGLRKGDALSPFLISFGDGGVEQLHDGCCY